jgi:hypothetical protein
LHGAAREAGRARRQLAGRCVFVLYACVILLLAVHLVRYLRYAVAAIRYPFELDYGEGIVWQQALLIPGERMYGDITRFPFIVFHYPPLYHLAVRALAAPGIDWLIAGRSISVACTAAIGALAAALSYDAVQQRVGRGAAAAGAAVSGLTVFCYGPVVYWSPLMRVDMMAIALSFLGVWLAGRAGGRPWLLRLAVLSFVLAIYTKQNSIAAPLAVLAVSLRADWRRAVNAFGPGLAVGLAALLALSWATHGGFLRHLLLYNLNRFNLGAVLAWVPEESPHGLFLVLAIGGLAAGWQLALRHRGTQPAVAFRLRLDSDVTTRLMAILTLYLLLSTGMLASLGKSGATLNYLVEWMCIWSVLIGVLVASVIAPVAAVGRLAGSPAGGKRAAAALLVLATLFIQVMVMPTSVDRGTDDPGRVQRLEALVARIREARRPVLSDDMVLLMKAGKEVPWEPAIFAELASTGRWDERLITGVIAARAFAFIITSVPPPAPARDERFNPAVGAAIENAYPRIEEVAGHQIHLPLP